MANKTETKKKHKSKTLIIDDVSNSANNKTVDKRHYYYHGNDCYVYETICGNCKEKVGGWSEEQANQKWNEHYC